MVHAHFLFVLATVTAVFDEDVLAAFTSLNGLRPLTPEQRAQVALPLALGGFGLRSTYALRQAAWLGSWALCLAPVRAQTGLATLDNLAESATYLQRSGQTQRQVGRRLAESIRYKDSPCTVTSITVDGSSAPCGTAVSTIERGNWNQSKLPLVFWCGHLDLACTRDMTHGCLLSLLACPAAQPLSFTR